jgi:lysosomal acid lipase/cholesteryl ester hydrolase
MAFAIPFLGRLHPMEYIAILFSFYLVLLEGFIRTLTLALPSPIINICYRWSRRLFNYLSSPRSKRSRAAKKKIVSSIAQAADFVELCELYGYYAEEHIVQTKDGYLLGLHRLGWKKGEDEASVRVNRGEEGSLKKKVVYLHHGLMMNSEIWVCLTEQERCLPFLLVERGYDVWLGNNRGNKYSKKSTTMTPNEAKFWSFSIDQFAFHDIPDSIDYILSTTHQPTLSYIGFSQGTAQAFAALAVHPQLNQKVDLFVALAPAMNPPGVASGIVDSFVKTSPEVLFLMFGRRALLTSTTMWQAILYPPIFVRLIDLSLSFLFGWRTKNIQPHQKLAAYPHLYSFTSTKSVVHWFQIIRHGKFQMYDDEYQAPWNVDSARFYKVPRFPTRNIKTPVLLVYGGSDSLVEINTMLKELPKHTIAKEVPHYEHLDFLWAHDVDKLVFPHVFQALEQHSAPQGMESTGKPTWLDTHKDVSFAAAVKNGTEVDSEDLPSIRGKHSEKIRSSSGGQFDGAGSTVTTGSQPAGWWSSDEVDVDAGNSTTEPNTPATASHGRSTSAQLRDRHEHERPASSGSTTSVRKEHLIPHGRGISLGKASSIASTEGVIAGGEGVGSGKEDGISRKKRRKA